MNILSIQSLSGKIITVSIITSLVVLSIGFSIIVDREEKKMMMMVKEHSEIISATIRENVRYNYTNIQSSLEYLQSYAESLLERDDVVHLELFGPDAMVIAHTERKRVGQKPLMRHDLYVKEVLKTGEPLEKIIKENNNFLIFSPVTLTDKDGNKKSVGVVELAMKLKGDIPSIRKSAQEISAIANINMGKLYLDMETGKNNLQKTAESLTSVKDVIHLELIDRDLNIISHTQKARVGKKPLKRHTGPIQETFRTGKEIEETDTRLRQYTRFLPISKLDDNSEVIMVAELVMDLTHAQHGISGMRISMVNTAGAMALIIIIVLTLFLRRIVVTPVKRLTKAAQAVSDGDLEARVDAVSKDELGNLAESFNKMTMDLKAYQRKLERAKEAAEEANRVKSLFIANVNHEIGSPLQSILGLSQLIKDGMCNDREEEKKFMDDIVVSAFHLQGLMKGLLNLSIIETGKRPPSINIYHVDEIFERVRQITWMQAKDKNLELIFEHVDCEKDPAVYCDSTHLQEALVNFVSNAIKFTDTGSITLRVSCLKQEGKIHIDIIDTGIGIEKDRIKDIFEPFVQVSGEKKRGGSGLGLSIARELITSMGGGVSVHSDGLGTGTTFTIVLSIPEEQNLEI